MKVCVIGNGNVGLAAFRELTDLTGIDQLVLVGRNEDKVLAEVDDILDGQAIRLWSGPRLSSGGYKETAGADILVYTAGAARKEGQTRLDLIDSNLKVVRQVFENVNQYNRDAIVIVVSNPVDLITAEIVRITGRKRSRVIGTGTLLDTARAKRRLASLLDVDTANINIMVLGEHGDSQCVAWSRSKVLGMSIDEYLSMDVGGESEMDQVLFAQNVKASAMKIIENKGYTAQGVAICVDRVVRAIVTNSHEILPLSVVLEGEYGLKDVALSVPCQIGREGLLDIKQVLLSEEEKKKLDESAAILKKMASDSGMM